MTAKLSIRNERMREVLKYAKANNLVKTDKQFADYIGIRNSNLTRIWAGTGSFSVDQITKAAELTGASLDYICGLQEQMMRQNVQSTPVELLEEALRILKKRYQNAVT